MWRFLTKGNKHGLGGLSGCLERFCAHIKHNTATLYTTQQRRDTFNIYVNKDIKAI
jgi:hypothetical protein